MHGRYAAIELGRGRLLPGAVKSDPGKEQPLGLSTRELGQPIAAHPPLQESAVAGAAPRCAALSSARDESSTGIDAEAPGLTSECGWISHREGGLQHPRRRHVFGWWQALAL